MFGVKKKIFLHFQKDKWHFYLLSCKKFVKKNIFIKSREILWKAKWVSSSLDGAEDKGEDEMFIKMEKTWSN